MSAAPWVFPKPRRASARLRIFCLPFAGGGAGSFLGWDKQLPADIEVLPIHLPGRERRFCDPPCDEAAALIEQLLPALQPLLPPVYVLFGHSMGTIIAYELAQRLQSVGRPPAYLLVSAAGAPHLAPRRRPIHALPPGEFRAALSDMGGTPPEVLANDDILAAVEPTLRADFKLAETYRPCHAPLLDCPVRAYGGAADPHVSTEDLDAWAEVTTAPFGSRLFPGGHFYMKTEQQQHLLDDIAATLADVSRRGQP